MHFQSLDSRQRDDSLGRPRLYCPYLGRSFTEAGVWILLTINIAIKLSLLILPLYVVVSVCQQQQQRASLSDATTTNEMLQWLCGITHQSGQITWIILSKIGRSNYKKYQEPNWVQSFVIYSKRGSHFGNLFRTWNSPKWKIIYKWRIILSVKGKNLQ